MICIYSTAHEPAPLLSTPLPTEHNPDNLPRPITLKIRKVRGKTGWLLRRYGHLFGAPRDDPVGLGHHALQIGEYVYEMTREKGMVGQRLEGSLVWESTVGEVCVGWTDLSDEEARMEGELSCLFVTGARGEDCQTDLIRVALKAQAFSRSRNGGQYHLKDNNCQHFVQELQRRLVNIRGDGFESSTEDVASEKDVVVACTTVSSDSIVSSSPPPSRQDSVVEGAAEVLKVRDSTFGRLASAAMDAYSQQDVRKGRCVVDVATTEIVAGSCD